MRISKESTLHYPILLFATIFPLLMSQPISILVGGVGKNSVWFIFPIICLALAGTWICLQISKRNGDTSLMLACGEITFRWLTPVTYVLYAILYLGVATYTIALSSDFSSQVLQYGSPRSFMIFSSLITTCAALFPMETLIRYSQVLMILVTPVFITVSLTMLMDAKWSWIQPVFNMKEMVHPWAAATTIMCIFSPLASVTLLSPKKTKVSFLSLSAYIAIAALFTSFMVATSIAIFGIHSVQKMSYLVFYGQGAVHIENFVFERVIFLSSVLLLYFKIVGNAFILRCAALSFAHTFGARLGIVPVLLVGGIVTAMFWKMNIPFFFLKAPFWLGCLSFALIVVYPSLIYIILLLRGRKA